MSRRKTSPRSPALLQKYSPDYPHAETQIEKGAHALFLSYDGLLDPLGASQILPYLIGIRPATGSLIILSFEKSGRIKENGSAMKTLLSTHGIDWVPLSFTTRLGAFGKLWDLGKMYFSGLWIIFSRSIDLVHARGHPTATIAGLAKRLFGVRFIFDFRGLWVDERVDKGGWDLSRFAHRLQFGYFKRAERSLLYRADSVVVLTNAVVNEVARLGGISREKITVIPCCADFEHFVLATPSRRAVARASLGLPVEGTVIGYLGSVGRMYKLDRFLSFFNFATRLDPTTHALVITNDTAAFQRIMDQALPMDLQDRVIVVSAGRQGLPSILPAMDVLVSFIQPSYARQAACPTKMGECFAVGIPSICNGGVGDIVEHLEALRAGVIVDPDDDQALAQLASRLETVRALGGEPLREAARVVFGLDLAVGRYQSIYRKLSLKDA